MNILKKISLGLTGTIKQILIIILTILVFCVIGLVLSFPLWYLSIEARFLFNILILIIAITGIAYFVINQIRLTPPQFIILDIRKKGIILINLMFSILSFIFYALHLEYFIFVAPFLIILSLVLNRFWKAPFQLARSFSFFIIFINFLSLIYELALAYKTAMYWLVLLLVLLFIPMFGYFLYENRRNPQDG
ncbi:MAG: hypothetical protein JXR70_08005 [Spirochaetales bacterium]|nr:hypothetical protein [Spirochaetales bacterium]